MKMKKICFIVMMLFFAIAGKLYTYDGGDFQIWNTDTQELKISDKMKLAFEEEFRWADNANIFYYHHYDAGVSYALSKHLSMGGGYRHIYELRGGKFKIENEPYLTAVLSCQYLGFSLEDRNRLEYRHFDFQDDSGRYRNKFVLKFPWKFTVLQIQPYIADEIFIGFGDGAVELNQNRFSSGVGMNLTKNLKADVYYMLVDTKGTDVWKDTNVLGIKLKVSF